MKTKTMLGRWRVAAVAAITPIVTMLAMPAHAQTGVFGDVGLGVPSTSAVMAGNPSLGVDRSTGAATASYPFALPAARGGVGPSLGLSYNSGTSTQEAGVGWGLGTWRIERRNLSGWPNYPEVGGTGAVNLASEDRFEFNGQPLIAICQVGQACPTKEAFPTWSGLGAQGNVNGWYYFRLQREGMFARFFWSPDFNTWRIQMKSGDLIELGAPRDNPTDLSGVDVDRSYTPSPKLSPVPPPPPFRWNIVRQYDAPTLNGLAANVAKYVWQQVGQHGRGYLTDVYDTPPAGAATTADPSTFAHHVQLSWEAHEYFIDPLTPTPIWRLVPDMRLSGVDVFAAPFLGGQRQVVRRYHLTYAAAATSDANYLRHHSFLTSIQLEGRCNSPASDPLTGPTSCPTQPPTQLSYTVGDNTTGAPGAVPIANSSFATFYATNSVGHPAPIMMDVNSDGIPDFVQAASTFGCGPRCLDNTVTVHLSTPGTLGGPLTDVPSAASVALSDNTSGSDVFSPLKGLTVLGDWTGNGKIAAAWSYLGQTVDMMIWAQAQPGNTSVWQFENSGAAKPKLPALPALYADIDADGILDAVQLGNAAASPPIAPMILFGDRNPNPSKPAPPSRQLVGTWVGIQPGFTTFFVDMNGDGLPDLASVGRSDANNSPYQLVINYIPGEGRGEFNVSGTSAVSMAPVPGVATATPFMAYLHDLNGDGYADLVASLSDENGNPVSLRVFMNRDGKSFDTYYDIPYAQIPGFPTQGTVLPLDTVYYFADMNGNGVDDLVVIPPGGPASFYDFSYPYLTVGPRPGLLNGMTTPSGATTTLGYNTTDALMGTDAWSVVSPQPMQVVTWITTSSGVAPSAGGTLRQVLYDYRDPAYDGWNRRPLGFRFVSSTDVGDANAPSSALDTTFFYGDVCQDPTNYCDPSALGAYNPPLGAVRGAAILSEAHSVSTSPVYHSTVHTQYTTQPLLTGADGRHVHFAYASQTDTFLYDTASGGGSTATTSIADIVGADVPVGQSYATNVPVRNSAREHLQSQAYVDVLTSNGNLTSSSDNGRVENLGSGVDTPIVTTSTYTLPPGDTSGWTYRVWTSKTDGTPPPGAVWYPRQVAYTYDAAGRVTSMTGTLQGTAGLQRRHEDPTAGFAQKPPTTASADGPVTLATFVYETGPTGGGALTQQSGPMGECVGTAYDGTYDLFPTVQSVYRAGCGSPGALATTTSFDAAFDAPLTVGAPTLAQTSYTYDSFGRVLTVSLPDPDVPAMPNAQPSVVMQYFDCDPVPRRVHTQVLRYTSPATYEDRWTYADGFGQTIASLGQADPVQGDTGTWVVGGQVVRNAKGLVQQAFRPSFSSTDPQPGVLPSVNAAQAAAYAYDAFHRKTATFAPDNTQMSAVLYHALSTDLFDALHLPGSKPVPQTTIFADGHGRRYRSLAYLRVGGPDAVTTTLQFLPTGEVAEVDRSHAAASDTYTRTLTYDSLGRLVQNVEPNTSTSGASGVNAWTYAYDNSGRLVGTSDARGCGKNLFYDGIGRLVAEDYSPCLIAQATYTQPNLPGDLITGNNTEVFNVYDTPAPGQPTAGSGSFWMGKLAATYDRGAATALSYDGRGRVVGTTRQIATPGTPDPSPSNRYAPWVYATSASFDEMGRTVSSTTGADVAELLGTNGSEVDYLYSHRGVLFSINSNYGPLVQSATFSADGLPQATVYGDLAGTSASYTYDSKLRLQAYQLARSAPALWTNGQANYTPPTQGSYTTPLTLMSLSIGYDPVGNPKSIQDLRTAAEWSPGAQPVTRTMFYDDFYRLTNVTYASDSPAGDSQTDPFGPEHAAGNNSSVPTSVVGPRVGLQTFTYDWMGNTTQTTDDQHLFYDRSLGTIVNGTNGQQPNQLSSASPICASPPCGSPSESVSTTYDAAGNLQNLLVVRTGNCVGGSCTQRFTYDWDEVGYLARARRWDGGGGVTFPQVPAATATADLSYAYSGGSRVRKSASDWSWNTLEIFGSLRLNRATWDGTDYQRDATTETVYLAGLARVVWEPVAPSMSGGSQHVLLQFGDHLGSTSVSVDLATSELAEASTYAAQGTSDSDFRSPRWGNFREDYRFTGKEEDTEVGITYFGARYYQAALGRWMSADPLTIHGLGADLNPYAYVGGSPLARVDPFGLTPEQGADPDPGPTFDFGYGPPGNVGNGNGRGNGQASWSLYSTYLQRHQPNVAPPPPPPACQSCTTGGNGTACPPPGIATGWQFNDLPGTPWFMQQIRTVNTGSDVGDQLANIAVSWRNVVAGAGSVPLSAMSQMAEGLRAALTGIGFSELDLAATDLLLAETGNFSGVELMESAAASFDYAKAWTRAALGNPEKIMAIKLEGKGFFCVGGICPCFPAGTPIETTHGPVDIDQVAVGTRVLPDAPECAALPERGWVKIRAHIGGEQRETAERDEFDIELLRPQAWVDQTLPKLAEGGRLYLDLRSELNVVGDAIVVAVHRGATIEPGVGCPVLGTIRHQARHLLELTFSDGKRLQVTPNHRLYSTSREDWVQARSLVVGEMLATREGSLGLAATAEFDVPSTEVFNLETAVGHRYFAGEHAVLAHNQYFDVTHDHHIFPQEFRNWFEARGLDIDEHLVELSRGLHLDVLHAQQLDTSAGIMNFPPGGIWNASWRVFIARNPNATADQVFAFGQGLCKAFGIKGCF